jgi:outer membrane lipoprotein-sorting protein
MKKLLLIIFCMCPLSVLIAQELSVDEIISKNLKAIGQEKLMSVQTLKITGKANQGGVEMTITQFQKYPDKARQEVEIQGMKIIIVVDGETGWTINPMSGSVDPQDLPAEMVKGLIDESLDDPIVNWDNPFYTWKKIGAKVELVGKENLNGVPVYNLKFTFKNNYTVNFFVDTATFLVISQKSSKTAQGQTYEQELRYSDFKNFEGILQPVKTEILVNGQVGQVIILDKCEVNVTLDDSTFKKPVKN